jgi:hypothetical protein
MAELSSTGGQDEVFRLLLSAIPAADAFLRERPPKGIVDLLAPDPPPAPHDGGGLSVDVLLEHKSERSPPASATPEDPAARPGARADALLMPNSRGFDPFRLPGLAVAPEARQAEPGSRTSEASLELVTLSRLAGGRRPQAQSFAEGARLRPGKRR